MAKLTDLQVEELLDACGLHLPHELRSRSRKGTQKTAPCGTPAAYLRHKRWREEPCPEDVQAFEAAKEQRTTAVGAGASL